MICPICNAEADTFLSFGKNPRPNAMCPQCGSMERHRLLWLYLRSKTNFFMREHRVLDIAPIKLFSDSWSSFFQDNYISIDLCSPLAKIRMDITDLMFSDNYFDWIICYHVLEHVPDDRKAMQELLRTLKPGGKAILQVPIFSGATYEDSSIIAPEEREKAFGQSDHVRRYGDDYADRLRSVGFAVTVEPYVKELERDIVQLYGLPHWEDIFLVEKPSRQEAIFCK